MSFIDVMLSQIALRVNNYNKPFEHTKKTLFIYSVDLSIESLDMNKEVIIIRYFIIIQSFIIILTNYK